MKFHVPDMSCGHCVATIEKALKAEDPTATLRTDPPVPKRFITCVQAKWWCQTNQLKHQKPREREFYRAIRERHSVRAASRLSLNVLRVESDLCELNRL